MRNTLMRQDVQSAPRRLRPHTVFQRRGERGPAEVSLLEWKLVFSEQRGHGFDVWQEPFVELRLPALYDLRSDAFERASHESIGYPQWRLERVCLLVPAQAYVASWLASFKDFPPRQKPASFSLDQVMQKIVESAGANR